VQARVVLPAQEAEIIERHVVLEAAEFIAREQVRAMIESVFVECEVGHVKVLPCYGTEHANTTHV